MCVTTDVQSLDPTNFCAFTVLGQHKHETYNDFKSISAVDKVRTSLYGPSESGVFGKFCDVTVSHQQGAAVG